VSDLEEKVGEHESYNLLVLAAYQVVLRIGWIFKVESIIIPAFLDSIAGSGYIRGWLPILNRIGQTFAPILFAPTLRSAAHKKYSLAGATIFMGFVFFNLAMLCFWMNGSAPPWLTPVFLAQYCLFFAVAGLAGLSFNALQGKLVRPQHRGRILGLGGIVGSIASVGFGCIFLYQFMAMGPAGFPRIFLFAAGGFGAAGLLALCCREPASDPTPVQRRRPLHDAYQVIAQDSSFRRVGVVAILFSSTHLAFPHYQALGRSLEVTAFDIFIWVIVQNIGAGVFSAAAGQVADRLGNRMTLRCLAFGVASIPLTSLWLSTLPPETGRSYYWVVFFLLGMTPVMFKSQMNYVLELAPPDDHPRYLSTLTVCQFLPFLLSVPLGFAIDEIGFTLVFLTIAGFAVASGLFTFFMDEPRFKKLRGATV